MKLLSLSKHLQWSHGAVRHKMQWSHGVCCYIILTVCKFAQINTEQNMIIKEIRLKNANQSNMPMGQTSIAEQVFCILMMCLAGMLFGGIIGEMQVLQTSSCEHLQALYLIA